MKKLTIRLDEKLHKFLKLKCVECDVSINEYLTDLIKSNIPIAAAKENKGPNSIEISKALEYIKATMSYENYTISDEVFKIMADSMQGKFSDEQARRMILERHGLV